MRILIINEKYHYGGSEVQSKREVKNLKIHGHQALLLTLDSEYDDGYLSEECYNMAHYEGEFGKYVHFFLPDRKLFVRLKKFIDDYQPECIHLNNADRHASTIFRVLADYDCIQTIRDYGAACPTALSVYPDGRMCKGFCNAIECCKHCALQSPSKIKVVLQILRFIQRNKWRRRAIKHFACPSQMLTDYCNAFGLDTTCINNPFDFEMLDKMHLKRNMDSTTKTFLYYGAIGEHKGVVPLLEAFEEFSRDKDDVELKFVGNVIPEFEDKFQEYLKRTQGKKVSYIGKLKYDDMISMLMTVHTVVVPSLWIENYPNTVLEAIACGCLVLGSERGGMREMIADDRFIFQIMDRTSIVEKLEMVYRMPEDERNRITTNGMLRVRENNSFQRYYEKLMNKIKECKA